MYSSFAFELFDDKVLVNYNKLVAVTLAASMIVLELVEGRIVVVR